MGDFARSFFLQQKLMVKECGLDKSDNILDILYIKEFCAKIDL